LEQVRRDHLISHVLRR